MEHTEEEDESGKGSTFDGGKTGERDGGERTQPGPRYETTVLPPEPSCECGTAWEAATVLDPFAGVATTGLVATRLNRHFLGIELNSTYAEMGRQRIRDDAPLLNVVAEVG